MIRISLRNTEVHRLAALLRSGATWEQAVGTLRERVSAEGWRSEIEALAKEPGPSARLPPPREPVDEEVALEAWRESLRASRPAGVPVIRSVGRGWR